MQFIDTHTHVYLPEFDEDRKEMMHRSIRDGVRTLLLPNIDVSTLPMVHKMVEEFPENCLPMIGLHPSSVKKDWSEQLDVLEQHLNQPNVVAVGEIGMDLYWDKTYIEEQKLAFRRQIQWAKNYDLPIVIHAREAFDEIFAVLDEEVDGQLRGVFHCFTGTIEQAQKIMSYKSFLMGIGGVVTYKKAAMDLVLQKVPLEYLILETDAPYLSPVPYRGKRNESSYLVHSAEKLADIYQLTLREIAEKTTFNANKLFRIEAFTQQKVQ